MAMSVDDAFGLAVQIAAAEMTKYTALHGPEEIAKVIVDCYDAVVKAHDVISKRR